MVIARRIACVGSSTPKGILFIMPHKYQLKKDTFASRGNVTFLISEVVQNYWHGGTKRN